MQQAFAYPMVLDEEEEEENSGEPMAAFRAAP
jgi:hypothetical protein